MSFLTGLDPQPRITYHDLELDTHQPLTYYLELGKNRPDLRAEQLAAELSRYTVHIQKGNLLPRADAQFRYYPYRVGFYEDIHWDALFTLTVPLFDWGTIGDIREAQVLTRQSHLRARELDDTVVAQIKKAYIAYEAALDETHAYHKAVQKAEASVSLQSEDFRLGLVTYADVLESQRRWLSTLRHRNEAQLATFLEWTTLHIVAGVLP